MLDLEPIPPFCSAISCFGNGGRPPEKNIAKKVGHPVGITVSNLVSVFISFQTLWKTKKTNDA